MIADGPSTSMGEIALGKNPLIGFMTWEGYNYEDAVLLSERLVQDDVYTSCLLYTSKLSFGLVVLQAPLRRDSYFFIELV